MKKAVVGLDARGGWKNWLTGLLLGVATPALAQNAPATVTIDVGASRHPINPFIYGVAYASQTQLEDLNATLNRKGGNATSRYNWQLNASNRANDYYFESLAFASATPGADVDDFIASTRAKGAEPLITIPMVGWVAKLGDNRSKLASFSIAKYGAQQGSDSAYFPDAGNGVLVSGQNVTNNDPTDANVAVGPDFQKDWVQHLVERWGGASKGGQRYYILDNEPSLWHQTHRDVHPEGAKMDEVLEKHVGHATAIKSVDPQALIMAPEEWGWSGYLYSGYDHEYAPKTNYSHFPDYEAHNNWYYLPWLLDQLRQSEEHTGQRLLDVLTVHYYPQGGEFSTDTSQAMQLRRNRSTRSMWDPNYVDETWINDKVMLVPRLKSWVAQYYPGTRVGITEYNWGAESHINGAIAQADLLGIFGREGLDYAARWETPDASTPTYKAMKLYRNYDGQKSTFGDVSVACAVPNPDNLAAFAAERTSDGALTVMVVSKVLSGTTAVTLDLTGFTPGRGAQAWQLTSANTLTHLPDVAVSGGKLVATVPSQSITLFVLSKGTDGGGSTDPGGDPTPTDPVPTNQSPVARITATPTSGSAPLAVSFSAEGSSDPDGTLASYAWSFGDGQQATGATASHTYGQGGTYTATLTVTDNGGASASTSVSIQVDAVTSPTLPAPTSFYAQRLDADVSLHWTDASSNEEGFIIERSPYTWPMDFHEVGRVGANVKSFTDKQVPSGDWFYHVKAFQGSATSPESNMDGVSVP